MIVWCPKCGKGMHVQQGGRPPLLRKDMAGVLQVSHLPLNTTWNPETKKFYRSCWGCRPMEERIKNLPERMKAWFTTQFIAPDEALFARLFELAHEFDQGHESGVLTTGQVDKILADSDKIQAELWRRYVARLLEAND